MSKLKMAGLIFLALVCAFAVYMVWFVIIMLLQDMAQKANSTEGKIIFDAFLKPIGLLLVALSSWFIGKFLSKALPKKIGYYAGGLYFFVVIIPYLLSFFVTPMS